MIVVISHNVCPSSLCKHLGVDLLQKIKHTLAHWPAGFSDIPSDIPALLLFSPSASDLDREFFSLLLNRTVRFEDHNEI